MGDLQIVYIKKRCCAEGADEFFAEIRIAHVCHFRKRPDRKIFVGVMLVNILGHFLHLAREGVEALFGFLAKKTVQQLIKLRGAFIAVTGLFFGPCGIKRSEFSLAIRGVERF